MQSRESNLKIVRPRSFGCPHRYLAKAEFSFAFVCEICGRRTEDLPIVRLRKSAATVLKFSTARH
jgi:hypothetical protein